MKRPEGFLNHELLEFFVDPKRPVMVGVFESDGVVIIIFADVLCYPHLCWCALLLHFQWELVTHFCQGYFAKSRWASHPESRSGKKGIRIFHRPLKNPFNKVRYNDKDAPLAISGAFCTKGRGGGGGIQRKRKGGGSSCVT